MARSISAVVFGAILALGLIVAFSGGRSSTEIGPPPEALVQFDEETTAQFNQDAITRENRDRVIVVLAITLGIAGLIVVGVGGLEDSAVAESSE